MQAIVGTVIGTCAALAFAQDTPVTVPPTVIPQEECAQAYGLSLLAASDACVGQPFGYICNGGAQPMVEPPGPVANSLATVGALVETGVVQSIRTPGLEPHGAYSGLAWLRIAVEDSPVTYSALMVGDVSVRNVTPPEYPAWQALEVQTADAPERCEAAPHSTLVVQNPVPGQRARLVINGVSLDLNGTLAVQTTSSATSFFVMSGDVRAIANGIDQSAAAGQEMGVQHSPGDFSRPMSGMSLPQPFRQDRVDHLPLPLFDRPVQLAQGGFATTLGAVNLRTRPSTNATIIVQTPAQTRVTLMGRNTEADWYHVRLPSGETGWMFAELLAGDFSQVSSIYEATPQPVQRLGNLGLIAHVIAPLGFDLRVAPLNVFPFAGYVPTGAEVVLVARSPYSPWVKINAGDVEGWIALLAIETRAVIDALPIDYDVPNPPEPTRIPGTFGNAFPDPSCYPNCQ